MTEPDTPVPSPALEQLALSLDGIGGTDSDADALCGETHLDIDEVVIPVLLLDSDHQVLAANRAATDLSARFGNGSPIDLTEPGTTGAPLDLVGLHLDEARALLPPNRMSRLTVDPDQGHAVAQIEIVGWQTDPGTGLLSREGLLNDLRSVLGGAEAPASEGRVSAEVPVLVVGCCNWATIDSGLGDSASHQLLQHVAAVVAETIPGGGVPARISDSEIGIALVGLPRVDQTAAHARELVAALSRPMLIEHRELVPEVAVGLAVRTPEATAEEHLRQAHLACVRAAQPGRGPIAVFDRAMRFERDERRRTEVELGSALTNGELELHFQAEHEVVGGKLIALEALIRWRHRVFGVQPAGSFIDVAEESGLITDLGRWTLHAACTAAVELHGPQRGPLMRVNLSATQLAHGSAFNDVKEALDDSGLAPERLCVEMTETTLMADVDRNLSVLFQLSDLGVQMAVDEFGSGTSVLDILADLPLQRLNVSSKFVSNVERDRTSAAAVAAALTIAGSLDLTVVAVGVERPEQVAWLKEHGCTHVQGFLIARPTPAESFSSAPLALERLGLP